MLTLRVLALTDAPDALCAELYGHGAPECARGMTLCRLTPYPAEAVKGCGRGEADVLLLDGKPLTKTELAALAALPAPPRLVVREAKPLSALGLRFDPPRGAAGEKQPNADLSAAMAVCDARLPHDAGGGALAFAIDRAARAPEGALARGTYARREGFAREWLLALGMNPKHVGLTLLSKAAAWISAAPYMARAMNQCIEPALAPICAYPERSMRHAIERMFLKGDLDALHAAFGDNVSPERGKPTNSAALDTIARAIVSGPEA